MRNKVFKIINILEPIIVILLSIGWICTTLFALGNIDWISLGGQLREWYWYEEVIMNLTIVLSIILPIIEVIIFFLIKKPYKIYTIIYSILELVIAYILWNVNPFGIFLVVFIFNLLKCIFRTIKSNDILKNKIKV